MLQCVAVCCSVLQYGRKGGLVDVGREVSSEIWYVGERPREQNGSEGVEYGISSLLFMAGWVGGRVGEWVRKIGGCICT